MAYVLIRKLHFSFVNAQQDMLRKIIVLLRAHRQGLTITEIAKKLNLNRNSTAKYLDMLLISGEVALNAYGPAKVYTVSHRMPVSAVLRFSADIIIMIDQELHILDVNDNALAILELSRNDLISKQVDEINSPLLSRLSVPESFKEILTTGEVQREFVVTRQDGDHHYRVRLVPTIFDNQEEGVTIIGEDITEQIRFEERLMVSEARFRAIVEDQIDFICRWHPDGTITFINDSLSRYVGVSCKDAFGQNIFSYICPEDHAHVRERLAVISKLGATPRTESVEIRVLDRNKLYRWHQWNTRGIYDKSGTLIECQSVGRDFTELKESQEALRESESKFREIFNKTNDAIHIHQIREDGLPGLLIDINEAGCQMLGCSREELLEKSPLDFSTEYQNSPLEQIARELKTTGHIRTDTGLIRKDGVIIPVEANAHVIDLAGQRVVLSVIRDITKRKEEEQRLRAQHALAMTLHDSHDMSGMLNSCLSIALEISGLDCGGIYLVDPETGALNLAVHRNLSEAFVAATSSYPADSPNTKLVMAGKPFNIPYEKLGINVSEVEKKEGLRTLVVVPIQSENRVIACIVGATHFHNKIPGAAMVLLETVSAQIGLVIARVNAEESMRRSEQRYRNIVEDQTEFICRFKPDGTHVFANDAYCRYFSIERDTLVGHRFLPEIPAEDRKDLKQFFASLTPDHPVDTIKHRIIMPDGRICWQRWSDRAIFDTAGNVVEYQSVGRDVTEVQEQILKTAESEERFRLITEFSPFPISIIDRSGNYQYLNKKFTNLFGYTLNDIPAGTDWFSKAFPDNTLRMNAIRTWKLGRWHEDRIGERPLLFPVTCKDGTVRQINFCPITLVSGEQFVVYEDFTHKVESDRLRSVLASIVNSSNDAIIGKTPEGIILSWNKAAERYYGYLAEEVMGKSIDIIVPPELRDQLALILRRAGSGETIENYETVRLRKDGSRLDVSINVSPIKDEESRIIGISTIARNIADRKKADGVQESKPRIP